LAATLAPSKQTATGRKGRIKDSEAAEDTKENRPSHRDWRRPGFAKSETRGKAYGNAVHSLMQYIRYEACRDAEGVRREVDRLTASGHISSNQAALVDSGKIARFFATEIGQKLVSGGECLREFKFSILDSAGHYGEGLSEEQVLLQGVVDCALLEPDGITIVDFKTDYVTHDTVSVVAERYAPQVQTYADALERIYVQQIKKKLLYFFAMDTFVEV
jgi:ATP-dependent helicase/nuclease subunit A